MRDVGKHLRNQWMGALALFMVLTGGTAWAATELTGNSVKSRHIINGEVMTRDLAPRSVHGGKLSEGSVGRLHLRAGAVTQAKLAGDIDADTLDGLDSEDFLQGTGQAVVTHANAELSGVLNDVVTESLGTIPGLGSFEVGGSIAAAGNDCRVNFTNTSGGPVVVNVNANPGLGNNGTIQLAGVDARPQGADASFTIVTQGATKAASGQVTVAFGFPGANGIACAGTVHGLVSG